jgi:hypothetical protein
MRKPGFFPPKSFWKLYKGTVLASIYGAPLYTHLKWLLDLELTCMERDGIEMRPGFAEGLVTRAYGKSSMQFVFPFMVKGKRE